MLFASCNTYTAPLSPPPLPPATSGGLQRGSGSRQRTHDAQGQPPPHTGSPLETPSEFRPHLGSSLLSYPSFPSSSSANFRFEKNCTPPPFLKHPKNSEKARRKEDGHPAIAGILSGNSKSLLYIWQIREIHYWHWHRKFCAKLVMCARVSIGGGRVPVFSGRSLALYSTIACLCHVPHAFLILPS